MPSNDYSNVNQNIAHIRKAKGMTQADIAKKLGMKISTYSQMERGGNISAVMLGKIADIFKIETDRILEREVKHDIFGVDDDRSVNEKVSAIVELLPKNEKYEVLDFAIQKFTQKPVSEQ